VQRVSAGDSIIALQHEAKFAAGPAPAAAVAAAVHEKSKTVPASRHGKQQWLNMVPWLKQAFHTRRLQDDLLQQQQEQLDTQQQQQDLVLLQLLLPSELLTGELASSNAVHAQAVAQHVPWSSSIADISAAAAGSNGGAAAGVAAGAAGEKHIDQDCVCKWLVGVQQAMQPHQQQQQQPPAASGHGNGNGSSNSAGTIPQQQQSHHHQQQQQQPNEHSDASAVQAANAASASSAAADTSAGIFDSSSSSSSSNAGSGSSSNGGSGSSSGSDTPTLPALTTQQVLKRALSEVGAFQLPAQTNRLALLFGPHASPAVCLSFGVEVFEPGHVTPLHTHSSAHELFFVLAGRAVGVHGPGGRERTVMEVGDVAVFPPGVLHGVDNESDQQLYCLQVSMCSDSLAYQCWL
jgi:mannose-6-phosphate isomerase-like protein (cupin superfamily)